MSNCPELIQNRRRVTRNMLWHIDIYITGYIMYGFFFTLKALERLEPIDCHYMTDRLQRFELKIFVCVLLRNKVTYILDALGESR